MIVNRKAVILVLAVIVAAILSYQYAITNSTPSIIATKSLMQTSNSQESASANWPTYHRDLSRSGLAPNVSSFVSAHLNWKSNKLDGNVYAEPLIFGKNVVVATENNSLYDLDADDGRIIWHTNFGTPVRGAELPCGDIDPSGITGTPVIDSSAGLVYVVAFLNPPHHELFAVNLSTGSVSSAVPADAPGMNALVEQQRGALALSGGYLYIPYGGLAGDCGSYHGWIVAYRTEADGKPSNQLSYQVPSQFAAGIWAPSGPAVNSAGELFVATGNSRSTGSFDYGNSVIKLSPTLQPLDWFAPSNWQRLNSGDTDLGSTGPILLKQNFVFQIGKEGVGYLLNATRLGGVGGQLLSQKLCNGLSGAYGGSAYSPPYLFVPCTNGIVAVQVTLSSKPSFNIQWRGPTFEAGPPVIVGNEVWTVDVTSGSIYALNLVDGHVLFQDQIGVVTRFTSLAVGDSEVIVSANQQVITYLLGNNTQPQQDNMLSPFVVSISVVDLKLLTQLNLLETSVHEKMKFRFEALSTSETAESSL